VINYFVAYPPSYELVLGKLQRIRRQVHGLRAHAGQHHIAYIFTERPPVQLHHAQIVFGTDIALLQVTKAKISRVG